jgi:hypothetical protein
MIGLAGACARTVDAPNRAATAAVAKIEFLLFMGVPPEK